MVALWKPVFCFVLNRLILMIKLAQTYILVNEKTRNFRFHMSNELPFLLRLIYSAEYTLVHRHMIGVSKIYDICKANEVPYNLLWTHFDWYNILRGVMITAKYCLLCLKILHFWLCLSAEMIIHKYIFSWTIYSNEYGWMVKLKVSCLHNGIK